jgi:hypothetical protein
MTQATRRTVPGGDHGGAKVGRSSANLRDRQPRRDEHAVRPDAQERQRQGRIGGVLRVGSDVDAFRLLQLSTAPTVTPLG